MCELYPAFSSCCGIPLRVGLIFIGVLSIVTGALIHAAIKKAGVDVSSIREVMELINTTTTTTEATTTTESEDEDTINEGGEALDAYIYDEPDPRAREVPWRWQAARESKYTTVEILEGDELDEVIEFQEGDNNPTTTSVNPGAQAVREFDTQPTLPPTPGIDTTTWAPTGAGFDTTTWVPTGAGFDTTTWAPTGADFDTTTWEPTGAGFDTTTFQPTGAGIDSTTAVPKRPDIDTTTAVPKGPEIDTTTGVPKEPNIDTTTAVPKGPEIDTTTGVPKEPNIDTTTAVPKGPEIDTTTGEPKGTDTTTEGATETDAIATGKAKENEEGMGVETTTTVDWTATTTQVTTPRTTTEKDEFTKAMGKVNRNGLNFLAVMFIMLGIILLIANFVNSPEMALLYVALLLATLIASLVILTTVVAECSRAPDDCMLSKLDWFTGAVVSMFWFVYIFVWAIFAAVANGMARDIEPL